MNRSLTRVFAKMACMLFVGAIASGCSTQESISHSDTDRSGTTFILNKPYDGIGAAGEKVERRSAIEELAQSIAKDGPTKSKSPTAPALMYHVYKGGLKQAISRLTYAFDYREVVFEGGLDNPKWDCDVRSEFWITGVKFEDIASRLIGPYALEMDVHRPDRVVVIRPVGQGNPCYARS